MSTALKISQHSKSHLQQDQLRARGRGGGRAREATFKCGAEESLIGKLGPVCVQLLLPLLVAGYLWMSIMKKQEFLLSLLLI